MTSIAGGVSSQVSKVDLILRVRTGLHQCLFGGRRQLTISITTSATRTRFPRLARGLFVLTRARLGFAAICAAVGGATGFCQKNARPSLI